MEEQNEEFKEEVENYAGEAEECFGEKITGDISTFRDDSQTESLSIKQEDFLPQFTSSFASVYEKAKSHTREEWGEWKEESEENEDAENQEQSQLFGECGEGRGEAFGGEQEGERRAKSPGGSGTASEALSNVYSTLSPFTIKWTFGVKKSVGLINLTTADTFEVFYASSHLGVLYDYSANSMTFLPGHIYPISSIAADSSGRWLVSADSGEDTVIIIWDNHKKLPVWSLYNVFPGEGTKRVAISQDGRFLAAVNCNPDRVLKFWMWTYGREEPDGVVNVDPSYGKAKQVVFNAAHTEQFALTLESRVLFCEWSKQSKTVKTFSPELNLPKKVGNLRDSLFLDDDHTALTSTGQGYMIVWCDVKHSDPIPEDVPGTIEKTYLKHVRIHKSGITSLQLCDGIVVSSSEEGIILFHDQMLLLVYWLPKLKLDPVVSVSFNVTSVPLDSDPFSPDFGDKESVSNEEVQNVFEYEEPQTDRPEKTETEPIEKKIILPTEKSESHFRYPSDCTMEAKPFVIRDFVFLTTHGKVGYVSHRRKKMKQYLYSAEHPVTAIDCNPNRDHIALGNSQGSLTLCEYQLKKFLLTENFSNAITTLKYSYLGHSLVAGFQNGSLLELDPLLFKVRFNLDQCKSPVRKCCFSQTDGLLAYYDQSSTVYLQMKKPNTRNWMFVGKYYSHYKPIVDIMFEESPENLKSPRLFTIGQDRMLVEYDTKNLEGQSLRLLSITRIEQTAIPRCFAWLSKYSRLPQFMISNDEYKLKLVDSSSYVCQKTTLGPTADTPINFMKIVKEWDGDSNKWKMVYTTDRHIGLRTLPPTGNPFEGMGMVAHHEKIVAVAVSHDDRYVFTVGLNSPDVLMWETNPNSVDVASHLGGIGLEPFVSLIEGGPNGFLFKEIEDFFYYAQIIHQGEDPNLDRSVAKCLALCEIPDLFRSLGYYPTNYEVENLLHELKHLDYEETGQIKTEVTFDECVKAFLNHRPVRGISLEDINAALLAIADASDPADVIVERDELYRALEEKGEAMEHAEAVGYLCILLLPKDENNPVPPSMALSEFAENVLGIDMTITEENVRQITHAFEGKNE